jgi:hypothetical protein
MQSRDNIPISSFSPNQRDIIFKILVFLKMCPDRFLIRDPWPHEELDEDVLEELKYALNKLMPLGTMVTDMWDWDIHFENRTFNDTYFDVAFGPEEYAIEQAMFLKEDMLAWIDEFNMDYAQYELGKEFEDWLYEQCVEFIKGWRSNIVKAVSA